MAGRRGGSRRTAVRGGGVRNVYLGPSSCYARREGAYVQPRAGKGVDTLEEALGILYLIERDLARGYTYDPRNNCRKKRMTTGLAERRARFLVVLAGRHGGKALAGKVERLVESWIRAGYKLPAKARRGALKWLRGRAAVAWLR